MAVVPQEAIDQFEALMEEEVDESPKRTFQNIHQGYPCETLMRFLKAREGNVTKAHKMLVDCLNWRVQNDIDDMLAKPIVPVELYRAIRDSQLIGLSGYTNEGLPVFAVGVGLSTFDRASVHYYVQSHIQINEYRDRVILPAATKKYGRHVSKCIKVLDMTGLKLSALNQIKLMTIISSIDDLNYPEKTLTYYIVNAPYVFSACWKVVKPLLQERTRRKINVLSGCGQDDLLKIMNYSSLPHFCRKRCSGSSKHLQNNADNCFSLDHPFHQQLYNYIKQQFLVRNPVEPVKQGSVHVTLPEDADEGDIAKILESELEKFEDLQRCPESLKDLKINDDKC
ncbi:SEC14 cytosolic factor [Sesamum angolense]|uniref:SEC14 cytosolic factor n=1 Tax=Sesamum angolense TaxID=2727404 RepID=A0AAE1WT97_9LAMI|nr:SEC14 cytosolic factor [Sesamum angolense]